MLWGRWNTRVQWSVQMRDTDRPALVILHVKCCQSRCRAQQIPDPTVTDWHSSGKITRHFYAFKRSKRVKGNQCFKNTSFTVFESIHWTSKIPREAAICITPLKDRRMTGCPRRTGELIATEVQRSARHRPLPFKLTPQKKTGKEQQMQHAPTTQPFSIEISHDISC